MHEASASREKRSSATQPAYERHVAYAIAGFGTARSMNAIVRTGAGRALSPACEQDAEASAEHQGCLDRGDLLRT